MSSKTVDHVRPVDQSVLDLLRTNQGMTVQELTTRLEVTATAVRQRLDRLVEANLIERVKKSAGRGRPSFCYELTQTGLRYASASYSELATALWQEVMELPSAMQRSRILRRVARRMANGLKDDIPQEGEIGARFEAVASALERRKVPAVVKQTGNLPVLEVLACPYPELTSDDSSRHLCELEQEMLSEAMGQPMKLDCCQLDGHHQCQFTAVAAPSQSEQSTTPNQETASSSQNHSAT